MTEQTRTEAMFMTSERGVRTCNLQEGCGVNRRDQGRFKNEYIPGQRKIIPDCRVVYIEWKGLHGGRAERRSVL
jgi:hypothetical protein